MKKLIRKNGPELVNSFKPNFFVYFEQFFKIGTVLGHILLAALY